MSDKNKKRQVFISYSWDDQLLAREIEATLKGDSQLSRVLNVWRDESSLLPGDHVSSKLADALTKTDYFVLLLSKASAASPWVQREIDTAVRLADKNKLTPVPILLDDVEVPFPFRGLLYIDGRPSFATAIARLLDFLRNQIRAISHIDPRVGAAESLVISVESPCQLKLGRLELGDLRFQLADKLTLSDVKVIWYDVFGRKMDDEVAVPNLAMSCVELLDRSRREDSLAKLIDVICRNNPHVARSLRNA